MTGQVLRDSLIKVAKEQVACDLAGEAVIVSLKSKGYVGLNGDRLSPLADLDGVPWHQDEAFYAPNLFLTLTASGHIRGVCS